MKESGASPTGPVGPRARRRLDLPAPWLAELSDGPPAAALAAAGRIAERLARDPEPAPPAAAPATTARVLAHAAWWRSLNALLARAVPEHSAAAREQAVAQLCRRNRALGAVPFLLLDPPGERGEDGDPWRAVADRAPAPGAPPLRDLVEPLLALEDPVAQLRLAADRWRPWLGVLADRLAAAAGLAAELAYSRGGGPAPGQSPDTGPATARRTTGTSPAAGAAAAFSRDADWMGSVVLQAKNTLVWLDQLSRRYGRPVRTLDQVPEEELAELASRGVTALWLIGVWQRSAASARIKELCGMGGQGASAYAVADYRVADELGGEPALARLAERARRHGIRMAGDMVPNHMGIDSDWVLDRPDLFLWVPEPPFPSYRFTGPDLSPRPAAVSIRLEDHYFDRSDAAVVFQHTDHRSGRTRYIYHGNDGTSTPWNDTAQIDLLNPAARERLLETIVAVARRFPVIRFDAAMVLVRRHVQRLWHPRPGEPGGVAGRGAFPMDPAVFDAALPREFWREVVERVQAEAPDTLLLAEAFWLLEDYFVRELGMHRVYNSALMHMLRDRRNAELRELWRKTLADDPRILERFVNFLTNPDEETAAAQFGKGDRYFGAMAVLSTLPGLPLLGHGQCEGYEEKYGMEFRRAWRDEEPDSGFLAWHRRMVFPLLRERRRYAGAAGFGLLEATTPDGAPCPDVLAYRTGGDAPALVLFNNAERPVAALVHRSVPQRWLAGGRPGPVAVRELSDLLPPAAGGWRLHDPRTGAVLELAAGEPLRVELPPYGCHVLSAITPR